MVLKTSRRGLVSPFIVMDVVQAAAERAAAGEQVLHLEIGQPATPAPEKVRAAAHDALDAEQLGYTVATGIPELRRAIAEHHARMYDHQIDPGRVFVTTGSSSAFILAFLAAFDAGDRVALSSPGYPAYRNILTALGIEVVDLLVDETSNFQPTPEALAELDRPVDGLIVASPSNPTGTMLSPTALSALSAYCVEAGIRLISDEIYHGITYTQPAATAVRDNDDAIVINSFSKYFSMTGWRLGWMVLPRDLVRPVECLAQSLFISAPSVSQFAALAAFDCIDELDEYVGHYAKNREIVTAGLKDAGITQFASVDGAFYIYADVRHLTDDSAAFCSRMLAETGVAATPGIDFDPMRGQHFVRFSFAGATTDMIEAMKRLAAWTATLRADR